MVLVFPCASWLAGKDCLEAEFLHVQGELPVCCRIQTEAPVRVWGYLVPDALQQLVLVYPRIQA